MTEQNSNPVGVRVLPEYNWRDVWHENCTGGNRQPPASPMRHLRERLTTEDGSQLRLYECVVCGARVFAGLDARRFVVHRPYAAPVPVSPSSPQPKADASHEG